MAKINTRSQKWYGWLPDLPDQRDFAYKVIKPRIAKLPRKVDLRKKCSPIENQGDIGACTAHALVGALEFLELKDGRKFVDLSRLFVYYNERAIEGAVKEDSGAFLRDGIKSLAKQGVCPEKAWPYKVHGFAKKPDKNCYSAAKNHQITSYHRLSSLNEMRICLADGYPFVFGFTVYSAFESDEVAKTGVLNLPAKGEKVEGGHAVMAVGYDDPKKRFIIRNSWDTDWGMKGYFTMPYDYLDPKSNLADDFWTIRLCEED